MRNLLRDSSICFFAFIIAGGFLAGCGPPYYKTIRGKDRDVFFPLLRATIPLGDQRDGWVTKSDLAMEMDFSTGKGNASQSLPFGEQVSLGGTVFTGPVVIHQSFTLDYSSLAIRKGTSRDTPLYADLLFGLLYTRMELKLETSTLSARDYYTDVGFLFGVGVGYELLENATLELRLSFDGALDRKMNTAELLVTYWLTRNAGVMGGGRYWKYRRSRTSSDRELVWQGYAAGLALRF